jgi:hypothetical protein
MEGVNSAIVTFGSLLYIAEKEIKHAYWHHWDGGDGECVRDVVGEAGAFGDI